MSKSVSIYTQTRRKKIFLCMQCHRKTNQEYCVGGGMFEAQTKTYQEFLSPDIGNLTSHPSVGRKGHPMWHWKQLPRHYAYFNFFFFNGYVQLFFILRCFFQFRFDLNLIKFSNTKLIESSTSCSRIVESLKHQIVIYKIRK